jgi:hypothetical protein
MSDISITAESDFAEVTCFVTIKLKQHLQIYVRQTLFWSFKDENAEARRLSRLDVPRVNGSVNGS